MFRQAVSPRSARARVALVSVLFVAGMGLGLGLARLMPGPLAPSLPLEEAGGTRSGAALVSGMPDASAPAGSWTSAVAPPAAGAEAGQQGGSRGLAVMPGRLVWPVDGMLTATAGWRRNPDRGDWTYQPGLEFAVSSHAPVRSVGDGIVQAVETDAGSFAVQIRHDNGWASSYGRLSSVLVRPDEKVSAGQVIAYAPNVPDAMPAMAGAGSSATWSGVRSIVSFGLRHGTESVDPLAVMPRDGFWVAQEDTAPAQGAAESTGADPYEEPPVSPVGP